MPNPKRPALLACAVAALAAAPAAADTIPQGGGGNNVVLAKATSDGDVVARASTKVAQVGGPTVADTNLAEAVAAGCSDCHANAVAVELVFATGDPRYVVPANVAEAANGCSSCSTFAYAWQYVVPVDGPVRLDAHGEQELHALEQEIDDAAHSVVPHSLDDALALQARLDALTAQLVELVRQQVDAGGVPEAGAPAVHEHMRYGPS